MSTPARSSRTRARDTDRVVASTRLDAAYADGQLGAGEYHDRTATAAGARTLAELDALFTDLQVPTTESSSPVPPTFVERVRRWYPAALTVVALVAAFGSFVVTAREDPASAPASSQPVVSDDPVDEPDSGLDAAAPVVIATPNMFTVEGITLFVDRFRAKFGSTEVDHATFYPEYVDIRRAVDGQPNRVTYYDYRGGFSQSISVHTRTPTLPTVDLAAIDPAALAAAIANAAGTARVEGGTVSMVTLDVETSGDRAGRADLGIDVSNEFGESGSVTIELSGAVIEVRAFEG
ncbi:DUF1707 domain-containing protein [Nocardia sp. NPDC059180]|uniref:DUF1707 SHOCT-like domain-containing protein n=1 Tax=Nocardia sp. NPDC059180 TaxID=3346761 RepID=UPI0036A56F6F